MNNIAQLSQLDIKFRGTLWSDMQVDNINDLQNITYLFKHKIVWVKEAMCWYYYDSTTEIIDDDGNITLYHIWEKQSSSTISKYDPENTYLINDIVYLDSKIFIALDSIAKYESPLNEYTPPKWECIVGETVSNKYNFTNLASVIITTNIINPLFDIWVFEDDIYEKVEASIEFVENGVYKIEFYENEILVPKTGYVITK